MRRLYTFHIFIFALASFLSSCGQNKAEAELQHLRDSLAMADSIRNVKVQAERAKARQDSIDWVNFTSQDLATFELKGHVKNLVRKEQGWTITFDEYGRVSTYKCNGAVLKMTRDNKGRINYIGTCEADAMWPEYGSGLLPIGEDNSYYTKYKYDKNGQRISITLDYSGFSPDGSTDIETRTYKYTGFDDYGNWTSRNTGDDYIESRVIIYYEMNQK